MQCDFLNFDVFDVNEYEHYEVSIQYQSSDSFAVINAKIIVYNIMCYLFCSIKFHFCFTSLNYDR